MLNELTFKSKNNTPSFSAPIVNSVARISNSIMFSPLYLLSHIYTFLGKVFDQNGNKVEQEFYCINIFLRVWNRNTLEITLLKLMNRISHPDILSISQKNSRNVFLRSSSFKCTFDWFRHWLHSTHKLQSLCVVNHSYP